MTTAITVLVYLVIVAVPGAFIVTGLPPLTPDRLLTLTWVLSLGMIATLSLGAVLGSLIPSARASSYIALLVMGLVAISGIFYLHHRPAWLAPRHRPSPAGLLAGPGHPQRSAARVRSRPRNRRIMAHLGNRTHPSRLVPHRHPARPHPAQNHDQEGIRLPGRRTPRQSPQRIG